jgi:hypothetical protein
VIYVVANHAFGNVDYLVVHPERMSLFAAAGARIAKCVVRAPAAVHLPFVLSQAIVIIGVYDGVFALAHEY